MVQKWQRVEPTINTKIDWRTIVVKSFLQPDGHTQTFATLHAENSSSAAVIAITEDHKIIVARQFRPGPERIMDEIPGGYVEPGEDPQAGAERELLEETGYRPGSMQRLGVSCRDAYTNAIWYYYLALDCTPDPGGQHLDEHEYVEVKLIPIAEFIDNARHDRMTDPAAVLMAYEQLKSLQEKTDA